MLTPQVAARIDAGLAGKDTPKLINAALTFSEIAARSPKSLNCVAGDDNCLRAALVTAAVGAGLPDEEAKETAETDITKASPQTIAARNAVYRVRATGDRRDRNQALNVAEALEGALAP